MILVMLCHRSADKVRASRLRHSLQLVDEMRRSNLSGDPRLEICGNYVEQRSKGDNVGHGSYLAYFAV